MMVAKLLCLVGTATFALGALGGASGALVVGSVLLLVAATAAAVASEARDSVAGLVGGGHGIDPDRGAPAADPAIEPAAAAA